MSVRCPLRTRFVMPRAIAVSSPMMPLGASANGLAFSSAECGAWSVAMMSIAPSFRPSMMA